MRSAPSPPDALSQPRSCGLSAETLQSVPPPTEAGLRFRVTHAGARHWQSRHAMRAAGRMSRPSSRPAPLPAAQRVAREERSEPPAVFPLPPRRAEAACSRAMNQDFRRLLACLSVVLLAGHCRGVQSPSPDMFSRQLPGRRCAAGRSVAHNLNPKACRILGLASL